MTWAACECGCGWEGEDDVTQWCIEEAALIAYDLHLDAEQREEAAEQPEAPMKKPGEITDPVMVEAMRKVKEIHFQNTGVRT